MRKSIYYCFLLTLMLVLFCIGFSFDSNSIEKEILIIFGSAILGHLLTKFFEFLEDLDILFLIQVLLNSKENIRVSFAYLFRIQVDGTYFLIRGNKKKKFQPVGGVFQKYEGSKAILRDIFQEDDEMKTGNEKDLRGRVYGRDLKKFINWFKSRQDREITCNREFNEELIKTGILDKRIFEEITYSYVGTHKTKIFTTENYGKEFLLAEIYDLELDDEKKKEFLKLKEKYDSSKDNSKLQYAFVTEKEIRQRYTNKRKKGDFDLDINNHTFKILKGEHKI